MVIYRVLDNIFSSWSHTPVLRTLIDTTTGFTGREIARLSGIHPHTALKTLTNLEELNIVKRQRGGRDHIFTLNREHYVVNEVLINLFQKELEFREEIIKFLASLLKKRVYSAVIFGSVARKEEKALSDLDICCILNTPMDVLFVQDTLDKKTQELYKKFGVKLAPIYFLKEQFMRKKNSKLVKSIVDEGVLITGKHPRVLRSG